jgi:hypothetical protein
MTAFLNVLFAVLPDVPVLELPCVKRPVPCMQLSAPSKQDGAWNAGQIVIRSLSTPQEGYCKGSRTSHAMKLPMWVVCTHRPVSPCCLGLPTSGMGQKL